MEWVLSNPEVPVGEWCKDFGEFTLAGEGAIPKDLLDEGTTVQGSADPLVLTDSDSRTQFRFLFAFLRNFCYHRKEVYGTGSALLGSTLRTLPLVGARLDKTQTCS